MKETEPDRAVNSVSRWDRKEYVFSGREMKLKRYEVIRTDEIQRALDAWLLKHDRDWFLSYAWRARVSVAERCEV